MIRYYTAALALACLTGCQTLSNPLAWSSEDQALFTVNLACHAWDYRQTEWALEQNGRYYEGNPLVGKSPGDERLAATKVAAGVVTYAWGTYETKHRTEVLSVLTLLCAGVIAHNYSEGARP